MYKGCVGTCQKMCVEDVGEYAYMYNFVNIRLTKRHVIVVILLQNWTQDIYNGGMNRVNPNPPRI